VERLAGGDGLKQPLQLPGGGAGDHKRQQRCSTLQGISQVRTARNASGQEFLTAGSAPMPGRGGRRGGGLGLGRCRLGELLGEPMTIVQPGTIRTDMAEREQKFELPEYAPLVKQYAERFARYRQRRAPSAEQIASEIADLLDRRRLPLRVPVGLRTGRLFARMSPSMLGRLVRLPYKW
jgi:hypothetical protein